ncbi:nucleotide disphospho-sugar-binding domain-containing protein [Streptomyces sp. A5-4]|uniref:nucleotide disphospho-sugar-binding domain-containing protein n=1 Tax=Streptomyces sp. A5-4 TaxID=3384771 RepID=UPI003DA7BCA8
MKILYVAGAAPATVFSLAPLANALRSAGHEVVMASVEAMMPFVAGAGIPAYSVTSLTVRDFISTDRDGNPVEFPKDDQEQQLATGRWFARLAAVSLEPLLKLAENWRPDLVVGGTLSYAAPLVARHLGVPWVRQAWDRDRPTVPDLGADEELRPELDQLGLDRLPDPDLLIDITPPSLRPADAPPAQLMRLMPANPQQRLEPWMYTRPGRRICVTSGSRVVRGQDDFLRTLAKNSLDLDADLVVAAPEEVAAELRTEFPRVRAGWLPLDVVAPTCDLIAHHGGGVTGATAINAGVPQLIIPQGSMFHDSSKRIADYGAAITLMPDDATPANFLDACRELMSNPSYGEKARELARETHGLPLPSHVVGVLEELGGRTVA